MLEDFIALQEAGRNPQLMVGPWTHMSNGLLSAGIGEALGWLRWHLLGDRRLLNEARVRVRVGGSRRWRELDAWPPPAELRRFHLQPDRGLAAEPPPSCEPDGYRYDPSSPTPSVGGPGLLADKPVVDNAELEARADVLTYTTEPLVEELEVIGPVSVEVWVRSSLEHFDLFARVCDVDLDGVSRNVCDALERALPDTHPTEADDCVRMSFELWPTAHRFAAGHRLRLQLSSGAHPRYARNPGTGVDPAVATRLVASEQWILHDPEHPSALLLPCFHSRD